MSEGVARLGDLATAAVGRDAVHVAVLPVIAGVDLKPGQKVILSDGKAIPSKNEWEFLGIVDPFLSYGVTGGDRFWLCLKPGTITGLRHRWIHPDIPNEDETGSKVASELWLRTRCEELRSSYDEMIRSLLSNEDEPCVSFGDDDYRNFADTSDFWHHVEVVTEQRFDKKRREKVYFSCAC